MKGNALHDTQTQNMYRSYPLPDHSLFPAYASGKNQAATDILTADIDNYFSFSLKNGFYQGDIDVAISLALPHLKNMQIHYTTDGSTPTSASPVYRTSLHFSAEEYPRIITLKAIICGHDGQTLGGPYTATYFIANEIPYLEKHSSYRSPLILTDFFPPSRVSFIR